MSPDRLRLLIADDEPLARDLMRAYAGGDPGVEIVSEVSSGDALGPALRESGADVAIVDIRMPGADVFDVLARAAAEAVPLPAIVFATAFDAYAVRAFEMNAVDYLIKPFPPERFEEAVRRARRFRAAAKHDGLVRAARDLGTRPDRLLVPDGRRLIPIAMDDIVWIKAEADYARVHANGRGFLLSRSLKELSDRLDPRRFIRIHRSAIVQASHIREVHPEGGSRYRVTLSDGTRVIVSRTRAPALRTWLP